MDYTESKYNELISEYRVLVDRYSLACKEENNDREISMLVTQLDFKAREIRRMDASISRDTRDLWHECALGRKS